MLSSSAVREKEPGEALNARRGEASCQSSCSTLVSEMPWAAQMHCCYSLAATRMARKEPYARSRDLELAERADRAGDIHCSRVETAMQLSSAIMRYSSNQIDEKRTRGRGEERERARGRAPSPRFSMGQGKRMEVPLFQQQECVAHDRVKCSCSNRRSLHTKKRRLSPFPSHRRGHSCAAP